MRAAYRGRDFGQERHCVQSALDGILFRRCRATPDCQQADSCRSCGRERKRSKTARMTDYLILGGGSAVTDGMGWVRGLQGLRVCDASLMPTIPRANTNTPAPMMAERIADLMRS
jgi:hypothetical protein